MNTYFPFSVQFLIFFFKSCLGGNLDTGFKSKGKGNDWKVSHKITQWRSQEESLTVPEALANSSCKWTKFPSPTSPPQPRSLLTKRNSSVHNTEKLTKAGWEEAERAVGFLRLYLLGVTRKERKQLFLDLTGWLSSYYVLGTMPRILHTLSNFILIAGNQARLLLSQS